MAAELEDEDVTSYLTKHKVTALFEELMAKVSKQLPHDPIEFLIKKLQLLQQQRLKKKVVATNVASIIPTKILPQGNRIQVTGTSMASKTSKSPVSEKMGKSTSGLRPLKAKTAGLSTSSSGIKSIPAKTPSTRVARPATSSITSKVAIKPGSKLKPPSSTFSRSTTTSKPAMSRPATAPGTTKTGAVVGQRTSGLPKKVSRPVSSPKKKLSQSPAKPCPTAKTELEDKQSVEGQGVVGLANVDEKKNEEAVVCRKDLSAEQIDEFFGDDKKSSQKVFYLESDEEEKDGGEESDEDDGVEGVLSAMECGDNSLDIQTIMRRREESANGRRRNKKTLHKNLQSLLLEDSSSVRTSPLSLSVHDATESSDSEGEVEMVEDGDALRDEGVEVTKETRVVLRKSPSGSVVCARCACTLGEGDSSSMPPSLDFESASQVAAPVVYPHWGTDSSSTEKLQTNDSDQCVSSQVSLQSNDTWGGLAPAPLPQTQLSDEESEVQLPSGMPVEGHSSATSATHPDHASLEGGHQD